VITAENNKKNAKIDRQYPVKLECISRFLRNSGNTGANCQYAIPATNVIYKTIFTSNGVSFFNTILSFVASY